MPEPRAASTRRLPSSRISSVRAPLSCEAVSWTTFARACFATLVSASEADVVAAASIGVGSRSSSLTSTSTGTVDRRGECPERRPKPGLGEDRGVDAARHLAQLVGHIPQAFRELSHDARQLVGRLPCHRACAKESAISRCWIPSCRSLSIRRVPRRRGEILRRTRRARICFRVGARGRHESVELLQSLFRVGRSSSPAFTVITPHTPPSTTTSGRRLARRCRGDVPPPHRPAERTTR